MYETSHFTVVEYIDELGRSPYRDWLADLHVSVRARIQARIFRIESGNLRKCRALAGGVHELKFDFGPGFRVYFALSGKRLIVLLVAGSISINDLATFPV